MPKINVNSTILGLAGEPIMEEGKPVLLSKLACNALLASYNDEAHLSGEEKVKRFNLALKINEAEAVELSSEDIVLLKKLIAKAYSALIVGRAYEILEPRALNS